MISEAERFDKDHPDLCRHLRWKGQFIQVDPDPTVPQTNNGIFWCLYSQTCIGPDGNLAEPYTCTATDRRCYGTGKA
jgi:hypothetical protein